MKKIVPLFLGLAFLYLTGCPPEPTKPATPPAPSKTAPVAPGATAPAPAAVKPDVSKEVSEAVKETKEAAVAVGTVVAEKASEAATVVKDTAVKAAVVVEKKAEEAAVAAKEVAEKAVEKAKEVAGVAEKKAEEAEKKAEEVEKKAVEKVEKAVEKAVEKTEAAVAGKTKEVVDLLGGLKGKWGFDAAKNSKYKPALFVSLPDDLFQPDGMTVNPKTKTIFLNCPNFSGRKDDKGPKNKPGALVSISPDGKKVEKLLVYEEKVPFPETGQVGPMGLYFGPDGHLYVCDNQYFFNTNNKSRMLRVLMDGDKPTGKVEVVVEGTKLSNAVLWVGDRMLVTDTFLDLEGEFGVGCVWAFSKDEVLKAGSGDNPPIKVKPIKKLEDDSHCVTIQKVKKVPGCGNGGADGMTADKDGVVYFGNFGNGEMYRIVFGADGKATTDVIHEAGQYFSCCDGIFYDADTNKVYVNDSAANAIHAFTPPKAGEKAVFETLWTNGDTDGADGSLDQPCEAVVVDGKLVIANFDWPFPELINTKTDKPNSLSVINLK